MLARRVQRVRGAVEGGPEGGVVLHRAHDAVDGRGVRVDEDLSAQLVVGGRRLAPDLREAEEEELVVAEVRKAGVRKARLRPGQLRVRAVGAERGVNA